MVPSIFELACGDGQICGLLLIGGLCVNLIGPRLVTEKPEEKNEKQTKMLGLALLL